jgi:hypothetical protein
MSSRTHLLKNPRSQNLAHFGVGTPSRSRAHLMARNVDSSTTSRKFGYGALQPYSPGGASERPCPVPKPSSQH